MNCCSKYACAGCGSSGHAVAACPRKSEQIASVKIRDSLRGTGTARNVAVQSSEVRRCRNLPEAFLLDSAGRPKLSKAQDKSQVSSLDQQRVSDRRPYSPVNTQPRGKSREVASDILDVRRKSTSRPREVLASHVPDARSNGIQRSRSVGRALEKSPNRKPREEDNDRFGKTVHWQEPRQFIGHCSRANRISEGYRHNLDDMDRHKRSKSAQHQHPGERETSRWYRNVPGQNSFSNNRGNVKEFPQAYRR